MLYCTSSFTKLHQYYRGNDVFAEFLLLRSFSTKIQHIHKTEITTPVTSHRLTPSACDAALQRWCLHHLHFLHRLWYYTPSLLLSALGLWCHLPKQVRHSYAMCTHALLLDICFFLNSYFFVNSNKFLYLLPK